MFYDCALLLLVLVSSLLIHSRFFQQTGVRQRTSSNCISPDLRSSRKSEQLLGLANSDSFKAFLHCWSCTRQAEPTAEPGLLFIQVEIGSVSSYSHPYSPFFFLVTTVLYKHLVSLPIYSSLPCYWAHLHVH